ncbi:GNAT family N-acetyltransferase [Chitinophaga filiformis]|uniref:N-acetyltransferase family protein n=1 Tax=Chitinophaga filiformis TaxID=104663 RepID=A0ABY4I9A6_CHIFI|nr:GNAT family N-acetyltransferase [Chitinophaga filiformis]UPK72467.1 N-acetyltransferase family protein [Chitinophaga filiformis]
MQIQSLLDIHWQEVKGIYESGIATGNATFQTTVPEWEEWDKGHTKDCRYVAIENGKVLGWVALSPVSGRCVYAGVAEVSVYVSEDARGKGIGDLLLKKAIKESEKHSFWTLQSGIFPENTASIKLHEKNGFRNVGYREKIGKMNGIWRDTVLMERRSTSVGI